MRGASKVVAFEEKRYPSRTTSKSSYTSEMVSTVSSQSACLKGDKSKDAASWSRQLPVVKTALNTVIKEAFADISVEKGDAVKKPAIIDLCDEDKRRIVNLVEELAKHVEEKRVLSIEVGELRRVVGELREEAEGTAAELGRARSEVTRAEGERERSEALHAAERQALQTELALIKHESEALERELEETAAHRERLEERLGARHARNRDLERERLRLRSQLAHVRRKLHHTTRVADMCRGDLRNAVELLRRHEEGGRGEDAATQTGGDGETPPPPPPMGDMGIESLLLGELFFTAPGIPREMEPIFFLPAPFDRCPEDRDVWNFSHNRM